MDQPIPYCGAAPAPTEIWTSWNLDPLLILLLLVGLIAGPRFASRPQLFVIGWFVLALAFISPLCALTTTLFSARAVHHLVLICVAAPLLAYGLPLRLLPAQIAAGLTALALAIWHVPAIYTAAWDSVAVYWLMQAALILPAWMFWSAIVTGDRSGDKVLTDALWIGALAGVMGLIGAVLTFATRPLYPEHFMLTLAWGLDPLADQHAAGLVMWVPGLLPLAVVATIMMRDAWRKGVAA